MTREPTRRSVNSACMALRGGLRIRAWSVAEHVTSHRTIMHEQRFFPEGSRVFENEFAERYLSRVHPAFPGVFWGPIALLAIGWGAYAGVPLWATGGMAVAGFLSWTLFEYILHRWVFHFVPESDTVKRLWYPVHQIHHDFQEWDRIVAPPLLSGGLCAIFLALFWLVFGTPWMWPFFGGFTLGYLAYDYVHYFTHFGTPKTWIGKGLRRRHLQHHHAWHNRWYGVSSPLWDYVFRTHVRRGERAPREREGDQVVWPPKKVHG